MHGYVDVVCNICNFAQPLQNRPDVQNMKGGGVPLQQVPQGGGPPEGWNNGPPPGQGPPPNQQPMRYG